METYFAKNIEDLETLYTILYEKYPMRKLKIHYDYSKKEYEITATNEKYTCAEIESGIKVPLDLTMKIIYGDSITGETPILLKKDEIVCIKTIQSIFDESNKIEYPEFKILDQTIRLEKEYSTTDYQVWSDKGWTDIKKVIKHKTDKKIFRIVTDSGCVDVTEDHSLCFSTLEKLKPKYAKVGDSLLHSFPKEFELDLFKIHEPIVEYLEEYISNDDDCDWNNNYDIKLLCKLLKSIGSYIRKYSESEINSTLVNIGKEVYKSNYGLDGDLNDKIEGLKVFITCTFFMVSKKEQIVSQCIYFILSNLGFNVKIQDNFNNRNTLYIVPSKYYEPKVVQKIEKFKSKVDYVYDLETNCGRFQAGIGSMIVSNTDSIMVEMLYNRDDFNLNRIDTFKISTICGDKITDEVFNKPPIQLEFEKVFQPFILLTKKRYIGPKFEDMRDPFKRKEITASGIALTRRDFCNIVKDCYKQIIDVIVETADLDASIEIYKSFVEKIERYDVELDDLVLSAQLAKEYKTVPVHVHLAYKLKERKEEVMIGSRIPYVFIECTCEDCISGNLLKCKVKKSQLGEDPLYIKKNNLKFNRKCYLEQLGKTLLSFFKVLLQNDEEKLVGLIDYTNEKLVSFGGKRLKNSDFVLPSTTEE